VWSVISVGLYLNMGEGLLSHMTLSCVVGTSAHIALDDFVEIMPPKNHRQELFHLLATTLI